MQEFHVGAHTIFLKESGTVWMPTNFAHILARNILEYAGNVENVLELGAGSGCTAILTGKLAAQQVTTLDINPEAVKLTVANWKLNNLSPLKLSARVSNLFSVMKKSEKGRYSLLVSNPPTFPVIPNGFPRQTKNDWEAAGEKGRLILDAVLTEGSKYVRPGDQAFFLATSPQGWNETEDLLYRHWSSWRVLEEVELPLAEHYFRFIALWQERMAQTGEQLIYKKNGAWMQKLYVVRAVK
jgi:methylase of polypeptide subunit release factors